MLLEKYEPRVTRDVIGNKKQLAEIKAFVQGFSKGQALLLSGPSGYGKTLAARLVAKELGYEFIEFSRLEHDLATFLRSLGQASFFFKGKIVVVDLDAEGERGVADLVGQSDHPVILTALNAYEHRIRRIATIVKFQKIPYTSIAAFLKSVCEKESLAYDTAALLQLSQMCNGDLRAALIDLETLGEVTNEALRQYAHRPKEDDVFTTLRIIFKTASMENALVALSQSDVDSSFLSAWLQENIAAEYADAGDRGRAYEALAAADVLSSRSSRRQSFSLMKYASLGPLGVTLAKRTPSRAFFLYRPPRFRKSSWESTIGKAAETLHVSRRRTKAYLPLLKAMAKKKHPFLSTFEKAEQDMLKKW